MIIRNLLKLTLIMWVKISHIKQDLYIMIIKKNQKGIYGVASKKDIKELKEEGIDTQVLPWFQDKEN